MGSDDEEAVPASQVLWILRIRKALRHPGRSDNSFRFMPNADAHLASGLRS